MQSFNKKPDEASSSGTEPYQRRYLTTVSVGPKSVGDAWIELLDSRLGLLLESNPELKFTSLSERSERTPPLAVLSTISTCGISFILTPVFNTPSWSSLHDACLDQRKTIRLIDGYREICMVAVKGSRDSSSCCFWGFFPPLGLYDSTAVMLNKHCLPTVLDLDGTLLVPYSLTIYENHIKTLRHKLLRLLSQGVQPQLGQKIKRYENDFSLLKQYMENDQVEIGGVVYKAQNETMPALPGRSEVTRPVLRLQEQGIVLTRIYPLERESSVLVKVRPSWEKLKTVLEGIGEGGVNRFEVFVCAKGDRDHALEMWRLLDPDFKLITSSELLDRVACIHTTNDKSLTNVLRMSKRNNKIALVIDDHPERWVAIDKPKVYAVSTYAPYSSSEAESKNNELALEKAGDFALQVRKDFFKGLQPHKRLFGDITCESQPEMEKSLHSPPDVGTYVTKIKESNKASLKRKSACGLGQVVMSIGSSCMNNNDVHGTSAVLTTRSNKDLEEEGLQSASASGRVLFWDDPGNSPASLLDRSLTSIYNESTSSTPQPSGLPIDEAILNHPAKPKPVLSSNPAITLPQPQTSSSRQPSGLTIDDASLNLEATPRLMPSSDTARASQQPQESVSSAIKSFQGRANKYFEDGCCFITLRTDRSVFGRPQDVLLDTGDVNCVCSSLDVSVNCVMVYIRDLYRRLVEDKVEHGFIFLKPASTRKDAEDILTSRSKSLNCGLVFMPLYLDKRWFLAVVNLESMTCYWLDSSESSGHSDIRDSISVGLKGLPEKDGAKRPSPTWEYLKCPTHESSVQSGLYIMKFMREITKNPNMLKRDDEPFPQATYEQDEIDEVRLEWIQTVNEALPKSACAREHG